MRGIAFSFVDGSEIASTGEDSFEVIDPSTGSIRGTHPVGTAEDANRAVRSARDAFDAGSWWDTPPSYRKNVLHKIADLVERHAPELDRLDAEDMGKPVSLEAFNSRAAASFVRFCAEAVDKSTGLTLSTGPGSYSSISLVPRGVVAAIVPWNFPTYNAVLKIGPALAAGNSAVLKPSELSPRSAIRLGHFALEAGLPRGVLNVLVGQGHTVGRALAEHMAVDMVAFTGSTAVGKLMLHYSSVSNMKMVLAECGGKSPQIVFQDCHDLTEVAAAIAQSIVMNQGQVCSAGSRVLVHSTIHDELLSKIMKCMDDVRVGPATHPDTTYGPVATRGQMERVLSAIEEGVAQGAELVTGGSLLLKDCGGYFVRPTILTRVSAHSRVAQQEIFGPVLAVTPFCSDAEALALAQSTSFGLATYVWTRNPTRMMNMARYLRAGLVMTNAALPQSEGPGPSLSVEPYGQSGIGVESGLAGIRSYQRQQLMWMNY